MKRANLTAASVLLLTFAGLALLPLTRSVVRSDARMASGGSGLGATLQDLGFHQENMPLKGIGPIPSQESRQTPAPGSELEVRLANAVQWDSPKKWAALQKLVLDFPQQPAAHAALARFACKNGGSVGIGRNELQEQLSPQKPGQMQTRKYQTPGPKPEDIALMATSCEAGERLDPDNAYFSAMAAVAYFAGEQDDKAYAALDRAAGKKVWREYIDVELRGKELRADRLGQSGSSLARSARMAMVLFPHYAQLRALSRLATAQAMNRELQGDIEGGLKIRRDVRAVGKLMRLEGSSLITNLVGTAMERIAMTRPGGAPAMKESSDASVTEEQRKESYRGFYSWLNEHGNAGEAQSWEQDLARQDEVREITSKGVGFSMFGTESMMETVFRSIGGMALLSTLLLLCLVGGLSFGTRVLGRMSSRVGMGIAVVSFLAILSWFGWNMLGSVRDTLAMNVISQSLGGSENAKASAAITAVVWREGALVALSVLVIPTWLFFLAVLGGRPGKPSRGGILRSYALPIAALFAVVYGVHTVAFGLREQVVHTELTEVAAHEGRYLAGKLGRSWPE